MSSHFEYVIYIRATPGQVWQAFTEPSFTRQYWVETRHDCGWTVGSPWRLMIPDGRVGDAGEVLEIEPLKRVVLSWRNEFQPHLRDEGFSKLTIMFEDSGEMVKLSLVHEMDRDNSQLIAGVSSGWPMILSSLKSLLETGESLVATRRWPEGM